MKTNFFLTYVMMIVSAGFIGGCRTGVYDGVQSESYSHSYSAAELAEADEHFVYVSNKRVVSPVEQHMLARQAVNPDQLDQKNRYSGLAQQSAFKGMKDFRIIKVDDRTEEVLEAKPAIVSNKDYVESILRDYHKRQAKSEDKKTKTKEVKETKKAQPSQVQDSAQSYKGTRTKGHSVIEGVRVGVHPDKTRLVFDLSNSIAFKVGGRASDIIEFVLYDTDWDLKKDFSLPAGGLVQDLKVADLSNDQLGVQIVLKQPGRLVYKTVLEPSGTYGYRFVVDVTSL